MRVAFCIFILSLNLCYAQLRNFEIEISKNDSIVNLPNGFIIPKSEILKIDTTELVRGIHYLIDYNSGKIFLLKSIRSNLDSSKIKLKAFYKTIPIGKTFYKYTKTEIKDSTRASGENFKSEKNENPALIGNIRKNGSIVRGFTLGSNRDLTLQSGFNLQLSGNLTKDIEVVASLTDENIPIQPEGNTQTLQEIDKIFIQVRSKNLFAIFGDYDIGYGISDEQSLYFSETPEFAGVRRRLQGGKFQSNYEFENFKTKNTIAIASSRGKFATNYFNGIDGVQGPYRLTGQNGEKDIIVIAGTEKVYIDGQLMTRGESNDYIIDYSTAEITFTPNRLITSASRITVDFQYTDRKYARNFFAFTSDNLILEDKLNLSFSYFYDSDNKNAPIDFVLSPSDIEILSSSGDDNLKAVKSGVNFVGFDSAKGIGKGQYVKKDTIIDSTKYEIFVYSPGDKQALYSVSFSYVGFGKGDYIRKGIGKYEFVGRGKGDYLPLIFLPMPQSLQLFDLKGKYKAGNFNLFFETALSNFDQNQFSAIDDANNKGIAFKYGLEYSTGEISEKGLRKIEFNIFQRQKNKNFIGIDRFDVVEFNRKWNIDEIRQLNESIIESSLRFEIFKKSQINFGYGQLRNENEFKTDRGVIELKLGEDNAPKIDNTAEILISKSTETNSKWLRNKGLANYKFGFVIPFVNYEMELREILNNGELNPASFRFLRLVPGVEFSLKKFKTGFSYELRFDDVVRNGNYARSSIMRNQNYRANFESKELSINADLTLNKKIYVNPDSSSKSVNNVLARFQGKAEFLNRAFRTSFIYRAMTKMISQLEPVFIKVQRGTGNYRYIGDLNNNGIQDPNEFERTKFDGDYVLLTLPGDKMIPSANVDASFNLRLYPERLFTIKTTISKILSSISADTYFQVSENSLENWEKIYLLNLRYFQREDKTISGSMTFRQDVYLFENNRKFSVRYRFLKSGAMYSYSIAKKKTSGVENSLRVRWYPEYDLGFQMEGLIKSKKSIGGFREDESFDISGQSLNLEIFYKPFNYIELSFKTGTGRNKDISGKSANLNRQSVKISWLLMNKGRIDFEVERNEVTTQNIIGTPGYELVEGNYTGKNVFMRLNVSYSVGDYIQIGGNYNGRFTSSGIVHIAQAEVRVYF
ncbi:hypothetical protein [Candidatus Chrysopegis kryptomonas]|uniref:Uncharacterized protein n=1 Tax=Candidatus Chryseopegocella kryptomonas TaxID=1633643 RepID=A0A0P1MV68_9BACT|nr:hypothetical protein [Candidatus Chrysopegis kryptomonas]CUS99698.1 hypothetical protein JGI23_00715 [Candidatus Chrysopegis kryptomonas]